VVKTVVPFNFLQPPHPGHCGMVLALSPCFGPDSWFFPWQAPWSLELLNWVYPLELLNWVYPHQCKEVHFLGMVDVGWWAPLVWRVYSFGASAPLTSVLVAFTKSSARGGVQSTSSVVLVRGILILYEVGWLYMESGCVVSIVWREIIVFGEIQFARHLLSPFHWAAPQEKSGVATRSGVNV